MRMHCNKARKTSKATGVHPESRESDGYKKTKQVSLIKYLNCEVLSTQLNPA